MAVILSGASQSPEAKGTDCLVEEGYEALRLV